MLNHNYDYKSNLETSLRINWRIEDVIGGRTFDYGKPFLPDALAGVAGIHCLNAKEKLKLNQIRGMTHPNFDKSLRELTPQGHARVAQLAKAIA